MNAIKKIGKFALMESLPLLAVYLVYIKDYYANDNGNDCGAGNICLLPFGPMLISFLIVFTGINIYSTFKKFNLNRYILLIVLGVILTPILYFILLFIFY